MRGRCCGIVSVYFVTSYVGNSQMETQLMHGHLACLPTCLPRSVSAGLPNDLHIRR